MICASQLFTAAPNILQQQRKQLKMAQPQKNKRRNSPFPHTTWVLLFFCNCAAPGPRHLRLFFRFHNPRVHNLAPPTLSPGRLIAAYLWETLSFSVPSSTAKNRWGLEGMKEIRDEGIKLKDGNREGRRGREKFRGSMARDGKPIGGRKWGYEVKRHDQVKK